jgi:hypothetical protein
MEKRRLRSRLCSSESDFDAGDVIPHPHKQSDTLRSPQLTRKSSTLLAGKGTNQIEEALAFFNTQAGLAEPSVEFIFLDWWLHRLFSC